jgi:histone H4
VFLAFLQCLRKIRNFQMSENLAATLPPFPAAPSHADSASAPQHGAIVGGPRKPETGGKGLGKGKGTYHGAVRMRKVLRDNIQGVTQPAIRRLARRGGVKRLSGIVYDVSRALLRSFLEDVVKDSLTYMDHAHRKTVTAMDVVYSLKRHGKAIYGFGG